MSLASALRGLIRRPPRVDASEVEKRLRDAMQEGYELGRAQAHEDAWTQPAALFDTGALDAGAYITPERCADRDEPLFTASVELILDLTLGTGVTYGRMDDDAAMQALEEWYRLNELDAFSRTILHQWLLDGELLALLAQNGSRSEPAWVNLWDTKTQGVTLNLRPGNPRVIDSVVVGGRTVTPDGFAWRSNRPLFNTQRGVSPLRTAVKPSVAYGRLVTELRPRAHEIRGRLNGVYYAFAKNHAELQAKAGRYKSLPRDGNIVTLQVDPDTGRQEKLELLSTRTDATDAEADARQLVRTVAMVGGFPEHYLAIGDTGNRATAESMTEPMIRRTEGRQVFLLNLLTELFRKELKRRHGPARLYRQVVVRSEGLQRVEEERMVPADELEVPFALPPVRSDGKQLSTVQYALAQRLISRQTATEDLGYDPALEAERMAAERGATPSEALEPEGGDEA